MTIEIPGCATVLDKHGLIHMAVDAPPKEFDLSVCSEKAIRSSASNYNVKYNRSYICRKLKQDAKIVLRVWRKK